MEASDGRRYALLRHLEDASWRQERTINLIRIGIWSAVGLSLLLISIVEGRSTPAPLYLAYTALLVLFGATVLRRRFDKRFPIASTVLDLTVLLGSAFKICDTLPAERHELRASILAGATLGLIIILSLNALRLDWKVPAWTGAYALVGYVTTRYVADGGLAQTSIVAVVLIACQTVVMSLAARRARQVAEQLYGDMRDLHEQRVRVMGRLVAGTAHELNSPLGTLQSSLHTLRRAVDVLESNPERIERARGAIAQAADTADTATRRIQDVLDGLRAFARPDAATIEEFDVGPGIESSAQLVERQSLGHLVVEVEVSSLPRVRGNAAQLNMVFLNLIKNASEAMNGRGTIHVRSALEDGDVVIRVRDHGPGVPPELVEQVFEPAFQRSGARVKMGLGLAVSRSIVQEHGGELQLQSSDQGATAIVRIPVAPDLSSSSDAPPTRLGHARMPEQATPATMSP